MADSIASQVWRLVEQAEAYADLQQKGREKALKYYNGDASIIPANQNYSTIVSRDVRKHVQKLMPSVMRTILSNDRIVEYQPAGPGDEEFSDQATDYVNAYVVPECDAERALHDAIFDALLLKTGVLNWTAYTNRKVTVQKYTSQPEDALLGLDEEGELLNVTQGEDGLFSFSLRRAVSEVKIKLRAVPRGAFLIHPNASSIGDSPIIGERQLLTRSELVSRGYDRETVWLIPSDNESADPDSDARRGEDRDDMDRDVAKAMETVLVYDVYVQMDEDGDGIAELHHIVMAEGAHDGDRHVILEHEPASEVPYADVVAEYEAHQFEGHSVAEDMFDVQEIKTTLQRQTLDNIYEANDPTPAIQEDALADMDEVYQPVRRKPIRLAPGRTLAEALQYKNVPFFGDKTWAMMQQIDAEAQERTGLNNASGALDPETLNGMSATGAQILNDAAMARAEMLIRNLARGGIRKAFRGILRLVVAHADQERTVRLRGEWVPVDPRQWNVEMDCTVNIGLGAGSRERDMAVLQLVYGVQKEIAVSLGPKNPLVKPDQLYNTLKRMTEAAGLASADPYFTKPDPQEIAQQEEQAAQQPSPDQVKAQTAMQIEQVKAQARTQIEEAQMQADLRVKDVEIRANAALKQQEIAARAEIERMKAELDMVKHRDQMELEYAKLSQPSGFPYVTG